MKIVEGDLLDPEWGFDAIGHGVNLRGAMGAGIAKSIAERWPDVVTPYRRACNDGRLKLGGYQVYRPFAPNSPLIFNLATQRYPGPHARLNAIWSSVSGALVECNRRGLKTLGLPQIGAGIGGLSWGDVHRCLYHLDAASAGTRLVIVNYVPQLTKEQSCSV